MFLDTYDQVAEAIKSGRKVVCRAGSVLECRSVAWRVIRTAKGDWLYSQADPQFLRHGDGLLHMVMNETDARGMEYHDSIGCIGEAVAARVRLSTTKDGEGR
jgi:hypothetical protein